MTLRLRTFGSVFLSKDGVLMTGAAGQRRLLALLTVVAAAGDKGISRDKVLALLWSEGAPEKSRHALTQALYHTRKALGGAQILLNGGDLRVDPNVLTSDLCDFQRATDEARFTDAVDLYQGAFLDGFYLNGDPGFDFWVSTERDRLSRQYGEALNSLASRAAVAGDFSVERKWREKLAAHDPLDGAATARFMTSLIDAGDTASALQLARSYEEHMRAELDLPPDRVVTDLVERVRHMRARAERPAPILPEEVVAAPRGMPNAGPEIRQQLALPIEATPISPVQTPRSRARLWWGAAAAAAIAITVVTRVAASHLAGDRAAEQQATIMVAPFRVASSDPSTAYLGEGLLDLLTTRIGNGDSKRAADPSRVLDAWKEEGNVGDSALSITAASRVARRLGAGQVVIGSVERSPTGVNVHATLVNVSGMKVAAQADVKGSPDSLIVLADRIINSLILKESGDRLASVPRPEVVSPLALRAFLAGRAAYRRFDYYGALRSYNRALTEQPGFAPAALGLAIAADRANVAEQHDRGLAVAWAKQDELSPSDRAYLRAFAGPRYPEPSSAAEALDAWEHVVSIAPDRAEGWHQLGESFYYDGEMLGMRDGPARAGQAFRRALQLDPSFTPSRRMLALLLSRQGDTVPLRRLIAEIPLSDTSDVSSLFVQWRAFQALKDWRALDRLRGAFDDAPNSALRAIAMTSQFDGVSVADGDRALEILRHRPLSDPEETDVTLARHSRALSSGDYGLALAISNDLATQQPALHPHLRLRVLDALYDKGDATAALTAAMELEHRLAAPPGQTLADSAVRLADACVIGQWRLSLHDTAGAREAVSMLRAGGAPRFPVPVGANPTTCAELIDVSVAVAEKETRARDRLAHLDSLMLSGPTVNDAMRYANLVIARQYVALGDPKRALAALQRRSYMRGWPRYRATGLDLMLRLALQTGDTTAARVARQRLNATRTPLSAPGESNAFVHRLRAFSRRLSR
jgi:DNA-binding SARP family transcriptional activator/TolB-like protein